MLEFFAAISAVLAIVAGPAYVFDIIKGTTKPERATWFIFSLLGGIAFYGQLKLGANLSLIFSGLDSLGSMLVFILSIKYGVSGLTILDRYALGVAGAGLLVSLMVHQPLFAIVGVVVADIAGTALTVRKVYFEPHSEPYSTWLLFGTAGIFGALSIRHYTFGLLVYPAYLVLANYVVAVAKYIGLRRSMSARKNS
jgi:hypothetical protein